MGRQWKIAATQDWEAQKGPQLYYTWCWTELTSLSSPSPRGPIKASKLLSRAAECCYILLYRKALCSLLSTPNFKLLEGPPGLPRKPVTDFTPGKHTPSFSCHPLVLFFPLCHWVLPPAWLSVSCRRLEKSRPLRMLVLLHTMLYSPGCRGNAKGAE